MDESRHGFVLVLYESIFGTIEALHHQASRQMESQNLKTVQAAKLIAPHRTHDHMICLLQWASNLVYLTELTDKFRDLHIDAIF